MSIWFDGFYSSIVDVAVEARTLDRAAERTQERATPRKVSAQIIPFRQTQESQRRNALRAIARAATRRDEQRSATIERLEHSKHEAERLANRPLG